MYKSALALALAGTAFAAPASATSYFNFSYSYDLSRANTITVSGQFTAEQIGTTSSYLITNVTGTRTATLSAVGPYTITGVAALGSINGNDNILNLYSPRSATDPSYYTPSANGIAFTEAPGASPVRIFSTAAFQRTGMAQENFGNTTSDAAGFQITITQAATAVPEPAAWALMLMGFGGLGYVMRRRSAASVRIRFA